MKNEMSIRCEKENYAFVESASSQSSSMMKLQAYMYKA